MESLGASHLASAGWEVQRQNNFEISIPDVGGRTLTLAIDQGFLPNESTDPVKLDYGNSVVNVAGKTTYSDGQIVIKDIIQQDTEKIVTAWRKQVYDPETDRVGFAVEYKKQARIIEYAPDGTLARTWKIIGAFPTSVNYGTLDYSSGDKKTIEMTITYDKAIRL